MGRPEEVDADTVIGLYGDGSAVADIAARFDVDPNTIYTILRRHNVELRGRERDGPDPRYDKMIEEYFSGKREPITVLAARHGTTAYTLYRELGLRKLSVRPRGQTIVLSGLSRD
jgi:transposase-like protein